MNDSTSRIDSDPFADDSTRPDSHLMRNDSVSTWS